MSEGSSLFANDFSNDVDGFSDVALLNIFEHSNIRAAILSEPSLVVCYVHCIDDEDLQEITKTEVVGLQKLKSPILLYLTFADPLRRK